METMYYIVHSFEGDYVYLKWTDIESDDLKLVARALLPPEIVEGSQLKYEMMQYELEDICGRWLAWLRQNIARAIPESWKIEAHTGEKVK